MSGLEIQQARRALAAISTDAEALDIFGGESSAAGPPGTAARRRTTRRGLADPVQRAALYLNEQGVLEWRLNPAPPSALTGRRAAAAVSAAPGELVDMFEFNAPGVNQVTEFLDRTDQHLNSRAAGIPEGSRRPRAMSRLWRLSPGTSNASPQYEALEEPPSGRKHRLLLVHGTFSSSQAFLDGFARAKTGRSFLERVFRTYDEVLALEHPTLSVSPLINALDLRDALAGISGPLDVIAHSRGGLVTRWALDGLGLSASPVRAVLVGTPLGGTSLAAPDRLRATLGLLSNFGTALQAAGGVASAFVPLLIVPLAILRVATSIIGTAARTPVLDGAIAMVPGLSAQSRVENNPELGRLLRRGPRADTAYALVCSDYQPSDAGRRFWRWFRKGRIANAAADIIFPGPNDLIVDTASMGALESAVVRHDFGRSSTVHHMNYFEQDETLAFIRKRLEIR